MSSAAPLCRWCGGALAPGASITGARRCLACGKGTIPEPEPPTGPRCGAQLECGSTCVRDEGHDADLPHLCAGDVDGRPGTRPA